MFRFESEMTGPAVGALDSWWPMRRVRADFVAAEVVGPDSVADLVAVGFDQQALRRRQKAGVAAVTEPLAIHALFAARRGPCSISELAWRCHVSPSGMRRAVATAVHAGAMARQGRSLVEVHPGWVPVSRHLVAVELKREAWQTALIQACNYACWANAAWILLGKTPPPAAVAAAQQAGVGLGALAVDGQLRCAVRPQLRRAPAQPWAAAWAGEQAYARALSADCGAPRNTTVKGGAARPGAVPALSPRSA
jgi:hypothetical protein